jgi:hypothetical protein
MDLLPAGVAVKLGRVCSGVATVGLVVDTLDTAMLVLYIVNVFDDITLEFDTVMVVVDDSIAVILRLGDETYVLDTEIGVKGTFEYPNDLVPVIVLKTVVATLSISVWFR